MKWICTECSWSLEKSKERRESVSLWNLWQFIRTFTLAFSPTSTHCVHNLTVPQDALLLQEYTGDN